MASFYGATASTSFYGSSNWYSVADLGEFSVASQRDEFVSGHRGGVADSSCGDMLLADVTPGCASPVKHAASVSSATTTVVHGPGPSFYALCPNQFMSSSTCRVPRLHREAGSGQRPKEANRGSACDSDAEFVSNGFDLAGYSMLITPKRPDRCRECYGLDKVIAACGSADEILALADRCSSAMDGPNWANLIYGVAHMKKNTSGMQSWTKNNARWSRCCAVLRPHLTKLTARDTCNVLWSLATLDARAEPIFMESAESLSTKLATCDPISVSKAAWALTSVINRDRRMALFSQLAVPIVLRAEVFPLGALTMSCYAFAKAGHQDAEVYSAFSTALMRYPVNDFRPIDVCNVIWAFCTVGYRDDGLFDWLCDGHLLKNESVVSFNPQDLANTAWGLSKVAYVNKMAMDTLAWGCMQQRESFKPIHFSNMFYSFATFRLDGPDGFLFGMADLAATKISEFDTGNLAISVWALSMLNCRHPLIDEASRILRQPAVCASFMSRTLSMLFLAFYQLNRIEDVDAIFAAAMNTLGSIGASGFSALMMTAEQYSDSNRETRLRKAMADEANDMRMRACIENASAIRLIKRGRPQDARALLRELRDRRCWSAVSAQILARLDDTDRATPGEAEREIWVHPVVSGIHPIAATRQNEGQHAYTREFMTLQSVLCNAPAGDVDACMACIEQFAESRSLWLKITAWEKAVVVHEVAKLARPKIAIEIGGYVGYSAMNLARAVRPFGGRVASIEVDPVHVCIVRNMVEYAGLSDTVDVWSGYCFDVFPHLLKTYGPRSIGMVFMDQKGTRFHLDLAKLEELDLLSEGAVILADNVLKPGAPIYIWHLCHGRYRECTAISVREFLLQSEDWMVMGFHDPSRIVVRPPDTYLNRLAFESDAFRKRSMFDSVAPSKSDWWAFSQRFVEGLERCGCKPRIVGLHGRDNPLIQPADIADIFERAGRLPRDVRL